MPQKFFEELNIPATDINFGVGSGSLVVNANVKFILTESGGIQEESCVFGTSCLTLKFNTERPVTFKNN